MSESRTVDDGAPEPGQSKAPDPALAALARARAAARNRGEQPGSGTGRSTASGGGGQPRSSSRGGPTGRDPVLLGTALEGMVVDRGWEHPTAMAAVTGRWAEIVGPDVAEHVSVEEFVAEAGDLRLRADSTAWATQMKMLVPTLMARLAEEVGSGVVRSVTISGPTAPNWSKGPRSVPGRGPRDTYG